VWIITPKSHFGGYRHLGKLGVARALGADGDLFMSEGLCGKAKVLTITRPNKGGLQRGAKGVCMPRFLCVHCGRETLHLNVAHAANAAQVSRTTVYTWIRRKLVHAVILPSGRKFICANSLIRRTSFDPIVQDAEALARVVIDSDPLPTG